MKEKLTPFDPADHLKSVEGQAYLLQDAYESGDENYIANALEIVARANKNKTLKNETNLSLSSLLAATKALGFKVTIQPV